MPKITFYRQSLTLSLKEGTELNRLPYLYPDNPLQFGCNQGQCGTCAIKVIQGEKNLSPLTKQERETLSRLGLIDQRLACQCALKGDVIVDA